MPAPPPPARPPLSAPRGSPLPRLSAYARVLAHHESTHNPSLARHAAAGQRTPHCMGRDNVVPPHLPLPPHPRERRTRQSRPHAAREHQKPTPPEGSGREGAAGQTTPHHPQASAHKQARKHPREHNQKAQTPNPNHPTSKHAHNKPKLPPPARTQERPRHSAWASKMCERGGPVAAGATGMKQSRRNPHKGGHAEASAHKASAQTTLFAPKRCRPAPARRGVSRERKAAHNSPRQSAWGIVFVGVFADVCRLFCAGGFWVFGCFFGVFGVFFGFLIFLGCCGCGLFGFVLVCFGWGLLCLVLIFFAVLTRLLIL